MITKNIKSTKVATSAYYESPPQKENLDFAKFKKEDADFCIYHCPHPDKPCKGKCAEYFEQIKKLKEKHGIL